MSALYNRITAMARIPVVRDTTNLGPLSARSAGSGREQRTRSFDPLLPFKIGPMNGRKARIAAIPRGFDERVNSTLSTHSWAALGTEAKLQKAAVGATGATRQRSEYSPPERRWLRVTAQSRIGPPFGGHGGNSRDIEVVVRLGRSLVLDVVDPYVVRHVAAAHNPVAPRP
jgi:hypothetical protein